MESSNDEHEIDINLLHDLGRSSGLAFEQIYQKYAAVLLRAAQHNIPSRVDCEEIVQDVFVSLWERRESLEIVSLRAYLLKAVRYKIIRYFQHRKVRLPKK